MQSDTQQKATPSSLQAPGTLAPSLAQKRVTPAAPAVLPAADITHLRRSSRLHKPGKTLCIYSALSITTLYQESQSALNIITEATLDTITPRTAREALASPHTAKWVAAMDMEKACHVKNNTFDRKATPPPGAKIVPADWVFKVKYRGGSFRESIQSPCSH